MNRIKRKLVWDDRGQTSGVFQLVVLIIILLVVWEFGAGYLGYQPLSSYLGYSEETPENISLSVSLFNVNTASTFDPVKTLIDVDENPRDEHEDLPVYPMTKDDWLITNHDYDIVDWRLQISTNAPIRSFASYRIVVELERVDWLHSVSEKTKFEHTLNDPDDSKAYEITFSNAEIELDHVVGIEEYTAVYVTLYSGFGSVVDRYDFSCFNAGEVLDW